MLFQGVWVHISSHFNVHSVKWRAQLLLSEKCCKNTFYTNIFKGIQAHSVISTHWAFHYSFQFTSVGGNNMLCR